MKTNAKYTIEELENHRQINEFSIICYAIMNMSSDFLYDLLNDSVNYEDIGKEKFVNKLRKKFSEMRKFGDTELILDFSVCNFCQKNSPICKFIGNVSGKHFGLYFEIVNDEIKDIFHCNSYGEEGCEKPF